MSLPRNPAKLFYRMDEVCRLTGLEAATIESWEAEFPFLQPGQAGGGQKIYRAKDVEILLRIRTLLDERNVTLAGARRRIEEEFDLKPSVPIRPAEMVRVLCRVRDELRDLSESLAKRAAKKT